VTLVDYSDFLCGVCKRHAEEVEPDIVANYVAPGQVRMVFRPVLNHGARSLMASEAAMCAAQQDQFWAMHELLFEHQQEIFNTSEFNLRGLMSAYSRELGLDQTAFSTCMSSGEMAAQVQAWDAEQRERGITIQPIFEINGQRLVGAQPFETFQRVIEGTLESGS
jgi:protein-disulfide isomerase